jgi:hypothetical protein
MSILDLIDGAVEQHGDAMRWSPEPDKWESKPELTPEQVELLRRQLDEFGRQLRSKLTAFFSAASTYLTEIGGRLNEFMTAVGPVMDQLAAAQAEHRRYVSRIHTAYHRRHR